MDSISKAMRKDSAATALFMHTTTEMTLTSLNVVSKGDNAHLPTISTDTVQHCAAPQTNAGARCWLPGPPPRRRIKELRPPENLPCIQHHLEIPVRKVNLWSFQNRTSTTLAPYFDARKAVSSLDGTLSTTERYLFHGCANEISLDLLESFSRYGPSIYFSRPQSYFSRTPAVYWTASLDFAFAWCVFSETGQWEPKLSPETTPFECLIYVSRVEQNILTDESHCYMVPTPSNYDEEQQLVEWCDSNMSKSAEPDRVPPPYSNRSDWPLIGSRIPQVSLMPPSDGHVPLIVISAHYGLIGLFQCPGVPSIGCNTRPRYRHVRSL